MHLLHMTKDGEQLFIGQMQEKHLRATINLFLSKIEQGLAIGTSKSQLSARQAAVLGLDIERIQEDCRADIPRCLTSTYPYITEAVLRWAAVPEHVKYMAELRDRLRGIMDRTGKMEPLSLTQNLPENVELRLLTGPVRRKKHTDYQD